MPVLTPHPRRAILSSGASSRTFATLCSCTTVYSEKVDVPCRTAAEWHHSTTHVWSSKSKCHLAAHFCASFDLHSGCSRSRNQAFDMLHHRSVAAPDRLLWELCARVAFAIANNETTETYHVTPRLTMKW